MKYAKITNNKIVNMVQGLRPEGYVQVLKQWSIPTEYPSSFYGATQSKPTYTIVGSVVHETLDFGVKTIDSIKTQLYQSQKEARQVMQLGSFEFGGLTVNLKDREDSLIISSLPETDTRYKIAQATWTTLTGAQVAALKEAHRSHVQAAYDWEEVENGKVSAMTTLEELANY